MQQNKTPNQRSIEERIKMAQGLQTKQIIKPRDDKELNCRNLLKDLKSSRYISLVNGIVQLKLVIRGSNIDDYERI
jgi:hypothetical protein